MVYDERTVCFVEVYGAKDTWYRITAKTSKASADDFLARCRLEGFRYRITEARTTNSILYEDPVLGVPGGNQ